MLYSIFHLIGIVPTVPIGIVPTVPIEILPEVAVNVTQVSREVMSENGGTKKIYSNLKLITWDTR
jgi:hypothetical protein